MIHILVVDDDKNLNQTVGSLTVEYQEKYLQVL